MRALSGYILALVAAIPALAFAAPHAGTAADAPSTQDRVTITVTLVSYPGVPERSACRMLYKAINQSRDDVELSTQLHTFDSYKADLNSWLVPTGTMKPGQEIERLYSCKSASFITLDQKSNYGWPRSCRVNGEQLSPCPVAVKMNFNLPEMAP